MVKIYTHITKNKCAIGVVVVKNGEIEDTLSFNIPDRGEGLLQDEAHPDGREFEIRTMIEIIERYPDETLFEFVQNSAYVSSAVKNYFPRWRLTNWKAFDDKELQSVALWQKLDELLETRSTTFEIVAAEEEEICTHGLVAKVTAEMEMFIPSDNDDTGEDFIVVIPARLKSSRLPNKAILPIHGKPMVQYTWENAIASGAKRVIIATESEEVYDTCKEFGAEVCLTSDRHNSGIERIGEVIDVLGISDDEIIVNLQGDEPMLPAKLIHQVGMTLAVNRDSKMATLAEPITKAEEILNPNNVKVTIDKRGRALTFSRAPMPWPRDWVETVIAPSRATYTLSENEFAGFNKHIGIYAYKAGFIQEYIDLEPCAMEKQESLEQLRVLWHGIDIEVGIAKCGAGVGVDTQEDLDAVREIMASIVDANG